MLNGITRFPFNSSSLFASLPKGTQRRLWWTAQEMAVCPEWGDFVDPLLVGAQCVPDLADEHDKDKTAAWLDSSIIEFPGYQSNVEHNNVKWRYGLVERGHRPVTTLGESAVNRNDSESFQPQAIANCRWKLDILADTFIHVQSPCQTNVWKWNEILLSLSNITIRSKWSGSVDHLQSCSMASWIQNLPACKFHQGQGDGDTRGHCGRVLAAH